MKRLLVFLICLFLTTNAYAGAKLTEITGTDVTAGDDLLYIVENGATPASRYIKVSSFFKEITSDTISVDTVRGGYIYSDKNIGVDGQITGTNVSGNSITAAGYTLDQDEDLGDVNIADDIWTVEDLTIASEAQGDILHFNGSNWVRLAIGTAGQVLEVNAGATAPEWDTDDSGGGALWSQDNDDKNTLSPITSTQVSAETVTAEVVTGDTVYYGIIRDAGGNQKDDDWDNANVHITSDGSDHTFIDQDVASGSSPTFDNTNITGNISVYTNDSEYLTSAGEPHWEIGGENISPVTATVVSSQKVAADKIYAESTIGSIEITADTVSGDTVNAGGYTLDKDEDLGDVNISDGTWTVEDLTMTGEAQGEILYFDGSNWVSLNVGSSGQVLHTNGAGADPTWDTDDTGGGSESARLWTDGGALFPVTHTVVSAPTIKGGVLYADNTMGADYVTAQHVSADTISATQISADTVNVGGNYTLPYGNPADDQIMVFDDTTGNCFWEDQAANPFGASIDDTELTAEDFGDWTSDGGEDGCTLDDDVVAAAEMADADHGEVTWAAGVATIDAESIAINEMSDVTISGPSDADILVYDASPSAAWIDVPMSSDCTIADTGAVTIADNAVQGDDISLAAEANGDVMYYNGADWVVLAIGAAGQVLEVSAGGIPEWDTDNSGDVSGVPLLWTQDNDDQNTIFPVSATRVSVDTVTCNTVNVGGSYSLPEGSAPDNYIIKSDGGTLVWEEDATGGAAGGAELWTQDSDYYNTISPITSTRISADNITASNITATTILAQNLLEVGTGSGGSIDLGANTIDDDLAGHLQFGVIDFPVQQAKVTTDTVSWVDGGESGWRFILPEGADQVLTQGVWQFRCPYDYVTNAIVKLMYSVITEASVTVAIDASVWCISDGDSIDIDTESYDTAVELTGTSPATQNYMDELTGTLDWADSMTAGDLVRFKIERDADSANDSGVANVAVHALQIIYNR